jgi:hypothetical protein
VGQGEKFRRKNVRRNEFVAATNCGKSGAENHMAVIVNEREDHVAETMLDWHAGGFFVGPPAASSFRVER